ncbi:(E2-independent) E3 ubiquitin-conjugating enzyme FATS [Pteronotus mesoamericanus]|uniref:(E2-independent) E3 ubiquitin-conjugating enzyme FATS n=1 Tax=Pteronotus mesoamericanus TaxID=1884717 RepID=UPI0023EC1562|nr:(E2-independent) E3 ubiquitin-conjugating enzyme FATS [Pteronotus parnellii mesoamericanus]
MVMDFVKKNWFPSQRRAKACVIHMYQGLRAAERAASGHEETLASPDTKMISSVAISQLMDESKSKEDGATVPVLRVDAQPPVWPGKQTLTSRSGVTPERAFAFLPGQLGIQTPAGARGCETELPPKEEKPDSSPQKGFASITITARRVGPPASTLVWGAVGDALCTKCRAQDPLLRDPSALAGGAHPSRHHGPFACTEPPRNSSVMRLKFPEAHVQLCDGHQYWAPNVDHRGNRLPPGPPQPRKSPLLFSSCVHLRVSQQCPNAIYYLDRPLSVPIEQTPLAGPKVHRSVLSLHLNCSSHRLTPDGAGGTANGGPISTLKPPLPEGGPGLLGPRWTPAVQPSLGRLHLGTRTCPWSGSPPLKNAELAPGGAQQITVRKGKEASAPCGHSGVHAKQLSIHIPGWSYRAVEIKAFSGSNEKHREARVPQSAPTVEREQVAGFHPAELRSPGLCPSSDPPECTESPQQQSLLKPGTSSPGCLCPLQDLSTSPQDEDGGQMQRELPRGDYTCCDLVVKIKECPSGEASAAPAPAPVPAPAPTPTPPQPAPPEEPEAPGLQEERPECQQLPATSSLTLQEALEVRKPQFISRSQERLRRLERMIQQRRAQRKESPGPKQGPLPVRTSKKQFTVPHPLSDNLFKPKERYISEKEMHMRSKRIYNNLPEVKKKKEEQKKRLILQSNRLRAEVFKKQLLDQLLQRNAV